MQGVVSAMVSNNVKEKEKKKVVLLQVQEKDRWGREEKEKKRKRKTIIEECQSWDSRRRPGLSE